METHTTHSLIVVDVRRELKIAVSGGVRGYKDVPRGSERCVVGGDIDSRRLDIWSLC